MCQTAVERALGKLVTDEAFRVRFFRNPAETSFSAGLELSRAELDALSRLPVEAIVQFSVRLDDRICRLRFEEDCRPTPAGALDAMEGRPLARSRAAAATARQARRTRAQHDSPGDSHGGEPRSGSHDEGQ